MGYIMRHYYGDKIEIEPIIPGEEDGTPDTREQETDREVNPRS